MITITNTSPEGTPPTGVHDYVLEIRSVKHPIRVEFRHKRQNGLAECLRRAADAVAVYERAQYMEFAMALMDNENAEAQATARR
jgi:hypothetical protein